MRAAQVQTALLSVILIVSIWAFSGFDDEAFLSGFHFACLPLDFFLASK